MLFYLVKEISFWTLEWRLTLFSSCDKPIKLFLIGHWWICQPPYRQQSLCSGWSTGKERWHSGKASEYWGTVKGTPGKAWGVSQVTTIWARCWWSQELDYWEIEDCLWWVLQGGELFPTNISLVWIFLFIKTYNNNNNYYYCCFIGCKPKVIVRFGNFNNLLFNNIIGVINYFNAQFNAYIKKWKRKKYDELKWS